MITNSSLEGIKTTAGEVFPPAETIDLARLVYKRFGYDLPAAAAAWRRLLQNSATESDFLDLVNYALLLRLKRRLRINDGD